MKKDDRIALLDEVLNHAKEKHEKRYRELGDKSRAVELILISWAFIFGGITGLYQANILDKSNTQQLIVLLLVMALSVGISVINGMMRRKQSDVPNLAYLWSIYIQAVGDGSNKNDYLLSMKEQTAQAYISSEQENREKLGKVARNLSWAAILIVVELVVVGLFAIFRDLRITA